MTEDSPDGFEARHEADRRRTYEVRNAAWNSWGTLDEHVIAPLINPGFMGGDFWPDTRQAHVASRRPDAVLLASDGLSDPFGDADEPPLNGWGVEFFAITTDREQAGYDTVTDLAGSWLGTLVMSLSQVEASGRHVVPALERFGTLSIELSGDAVPDEFRSAHLTPDGTIGALLNVTDPDTLPPVLDGPLSPIHLVNVKLLTAAETASIAIADPEPATAARRELADRLRAQGEPLVSSLRRASVV